MARLRRCIDCDHVNDSEAIYPGDRTCATCACHCTTWKRTHPNCRGCGHPLPVHGRSASRCLAPGCLCIGWDRIPAAAVADMPEVVLQLTIRSIAGAVIEECLERLQAEFGGGGGCQ